MKPRPSRRFCPVLLNACLLVSCCLAGTPAWADPLYTITDLGTLPGTTQSLATGINASGQVTGVAYTSSNGTWTATGVLGQLGISYDAGGRIFLVQQWADDNNQPHGRSGECDQRFRPSGRRALYFDQRLGPVRR